MALSLNTPDAKACAPAQDGHLAPALLAELSASAAAEEAGTRPIARSTDLLRSAGALTDDGMGRPERTARSLMKVGAANLSVGRLWEGHVNALALIALYAGPGQRARADDLIGRGAFLGVWGADGDAPVTWDPLRGCLSGGKRFASGLGTVSHAIVTVDSGPDVRLALIDVSNMARADTGTWNMQGMKATTSGTFDFTDLPESAVDWIGKPGEYLKEPHFVGGVWRIAALQVGAAVGLLDVAAAQLRSMGRMQAQPQQTRLMTVLMRAWAGISLVERAAAATVNPDLRAEEIVSASISARLVTEEIALDAIRAVEQSLGIQHFDAGAQTGRMARDLAVYLRQAARDAFLLRAAEEALGHDGGIWGIFQ
ncbi:acyl-CoA dehydrogenase [Roseovarius sp. D0-M9]|uniref:acyl-CoA dehydrogenase n=1 Tax=Roseovarius sp. D0-M9 TaxID=3127117 RepID=UPI003010354F